MPRYLVLKQKFLFSDHDLTDPQSLPRAGRGISSRSKGEGGGGREGQAGEGGAFPPVPTQQHSV